MVHVPLSQNRHVLCPVNAQILIALTVVCLVYVIMLFVKVFFLQMEIQVMDVIPNVVMGNAALMKLPSACLLTVFSNAVVPEPTNNEVSNGYLVS
jgi:hypothetical protein